MKYGAKEVKENEEFEESQKTRMLIKKELIKKALILKKAEQKLADFKEPIVFLIRRDGNVDFYENVETKKGEGIIENELNFIHSDGRKIKVKLPNNKILTFNYGKNRVRGYIHYEDAYFPEPQDPILDAESVKDRFDKMAYSRKIWKEERKLEKEKRKSRMIIVWIILAILGGIAAIFMFGGQSVENIIAGGL